VASIVGIANRATQKVGAQSILALDANTREARAVSLCYDSVRQALLRRYRWKFAKKRVLLPADIKAPAFGAAASFTLPADCIRELPPPGARFWHKEGRQLLIGDGYPVPPGGALQLQYISDVTDPNLMDPSFRECLAHKIAIEISDQLTNGVTRKNGLLDEWKNVYSEAVQADSFEDPPEESAPDTWITARQDGFFLGAQFFTVVPTAPAPAPAPVFLYYEAGYGPLDYVA
jgi:hypothetical protein